MIEFAVGGRAAGTVYTAEAAAAFVGAPVRAAGVAVGTIVSATVQPDGSILVRAAMHDEAELLHGEEDEDGG